MYDQWIVRWTLFSGVDALNGRASCCVCAKAVDCFRRESNGCIAASKL